MRFKTIPIFLALSLALNYLLILGYTVVQMLRAATAGQIYGDKSKGVFACHNFHTDLFYCSAMDFFVSVPTMWMFLFAIGTFGASVIIPTALMYYLHGRMKR